MNRIGGEHGTYGPRGVQLGDTHDVLDDSVSRH